MVAWGLGMKRVKPRDYQLEAFQKLLEHRKCSIVMPTGTGKTYLAIYAIQQLGYPKTLIIVPTIPLLHQWRRKLAEYGIPSGTWYGEGKNPAHITVGIYNSCAKDVSYLSMMNFEFIVYDEIHHAGAEQFAKTLQLSVKAKYALGLTATLKRADKRHELIVRYIPLRYVMTIGKARQDGWVSDLFQFSF